MIVASTPRLTLRVSSDEDAQGMYLLNADPEVLRYTGDPPFADVEEARAFLRSYKHFEQYGYGRWAVYLKEPARYLGFCGLKYHPEGDFVDLGYRLMRAEWRKGYATEAGRCALELGFRRFGLSRIVGRAQEANAVSVRVLQKLGMTYDRAVEEDGELWQQYEITSSRFFALHPPSKESDAG